VPYKKESDMYPLVRQWLIAYLRGKRRGARVEVFDASQRSLARLIRDVGLMAHIPPEWPSWDIHVDIVGFAITSTRTDLAFVECKNVAITLGHLSQLLGYSRVALPEFSFILAPQGASDSLRSLLLTYHRTDVLQYQSHAGRVPKSIVVGRWDETANCLDLGSLIASNGNAVGRL